MFENLLASYNPETGESARKQTGSFYTPRPIVDYMVDESLKAYLANALCKALPNNTLADAKVGIDILFAYTEKTHPFHADEVTALIAAIHACNILDPACGSGAYPMGVLHKLVFILGKLDPDNQQWKQRQIDKANEIADAQARNSAIAAIEADFDDNQLDYGRKLYLIENCIYGVDIQPIAIQIAKLRFFISLLCDQKTNHDASRNRGIRALPNLETKFVTANSLIGLPDMKQGVLLGDEVKRIQAEIEAKYHQHFAVQKRKDKLKLQSDIKALRAKLGEELANSGWSSEHAQRIANWDPFNPQSVADFFDAGYMFGPSVAQGFDVVIGNPPYLRVQGLQQTQAEFMPHYRQHFQSAKGSFDLYALFVERGFQLLHQKGQLAYILPHKFFQAQFGKHLRELLTKRQALRQVVRFGAEQVFDQATTYTCLLFLAAQPQTSFDLLEVTSLKSGDEVLRAASGRVPHDDYIYGQLPAPTGNDWDFALGATNQVLQRLQQHPQTLGSVTRKIFQGIATSADKIYVLQLLEDKGEVLRCYSKHLQAEIDIERGLVRPFLMGKDVHRYEQPRPKNVVIFPYWLDNGKARLMSQTEIQGQFPLGWAYLLKNKHSLGERERGRMHNENFYAYIYPKNLVEFDAVKIMTPDICARPEMTLDSVGNLYHTTTIYGFSFKPELNVSHRYLLGLMNSKVMWYFQSLTGTVLRGGYRRFHKQFVAPFPIPNALPSQQDLMETLVEAILTLKREAQESTKLAVLGLDGLIDALVYELYFPDELHAAHIHLFEACAQAGIGKLAGLQADTLAQEAQALADTIFDPDHPIAQQLRTIQNVEVVQVIEGKSA